MRFTRQYSPAAVRINCFIGFEALCIPILHSGIKALFEDTATVLHCVITKRNLAVYHSHENPFQSVYLVDLFPSEKLGSLYVSGDVAKLHIICLPSISFPIWDYLVDLYLSTISNTKHTTCFRSVLGIG